MNNPAIRALVQAISVIAITLVLVVLLATLGMLLSGSGSSAPSAPILAVWAVLIVLAYLALRLKPFKARFVTALIITIAVPIGAQLLVTAGLVSSDLPAVAAILSGVTFVVFATIALSLVHFALIKDGAAPRERFVLATPDDDYIEDSFS